MNAFVPFRFTRLAADQRGSVLTFWALSLGVLLGIIALSFDFGRLASTQSDLQSFADNVALAAAGELDGKTDAITRATAAAANMISDTQSFGTGSKVLSGASAYSLAFYQTAPVNGVMGLATTDPKKAGFVSVTVNSQTVNRVYGAAFAALTGEDTGRNTVGATAVAGMTQYACDITPLMFCAPSASFRADENVGIAVQLRVSANAGAWAPGSFGWLDPSAGGSVDPDGICAGLSGVNLDVCLMSGASNRTGCYAQSGVSIAPGQRVGNFEAAINVRFDMYNSYASSLKNDPNYPPAPNVLSSYQTATSGCMATNAVLSLTHTGLPPDDCQRLGTCGRFGTGNWTLGRQTYVATNYAGIDPHPTANTRYKYYLAEIERLKTLPKGVKPVPGMLPSCSKNPSSDPDRRVMVAASVDCASLDLTAGKTNVHVNEFVKVFLISPVGLDGTRDLWVEIIGSVGGGSSGNSNANPATGQFRDVVKLYK